MTVCASGPSYGLMVAVVPVDDAVKIGGGKATVCRYARLAVDVREYTLIPSYLQQTQVPGPQSAPAENERLTHSSILEDNQKTGIILPFNLEPSISILVFRKRRLDVLRL